MTDHSISTQMLTARCAGNRLTYRCAVAWRSEPAICPRCEQVIDKSAAPVMLDGDRGAWVEPLAWSQQHGCGEWVEPAWATSEPECLGIYSDADDGRDHEREAVAALRCLDAAREKREAA